MKNWGRPSDVSWEDVEKGVGRSSRNTNNVIDDAFANANRQYSWRQAPSRGMQELLDDFRTSPWLQAASKKVAAHFATVPWRLYRKNDRLTGKAVLSGIKDYAGRFKGQAINKAMESGEANEIDNHPLLDLLNNPNNMMSGVSLRKLCCLYEIFTGEVFLWKKRDGKQISQLLPLVPTWVYRLPTSDDQQYKLSILGSRIDLPAEDIIYMKEMELLNPFTRGTGLGQALGDIIDTSQYAQKFLKAYFYNNATPDVFIGLKGSSQEGVQYFQQKLEERNRGPMKSGRAFVFDAGQDGGLDVHEVNKNLTNLQVLPLLDNVRDQIVSVFGVPPEVMGILGNSNRATINEALRIFAQETIIPRLDTFGSELQRQLVPDYDERLLIHYDDPTPKDKDYTLQVLAMFPYAATVSEIRKLADLPDRGAQDDITVMPAGLTATKKIEETPDPVAVQPVQPPAVDGPKVEPVKPKPAKTVRPLFKADSDAGAESDEDLASKGFDESQHPRDDHGRFDDGTGGSSEGQQQLTRNQQEALDTYQSRAYHDIQATLRGSADGIGGLNQQQQSEMREVAGHLDAAVLATSLSEDTNVYRGINVYQSNPLHDIKPGAEFTDRGFVSTSRSKDVAVEFAKRSSQGAQKIVFEISLKKGSHALDVSQHVHSENAATEKEMLLGSGTRFRVLSVGKLEGSRGVKHIKLETY